MQNECKGCWLCTMASTLACEIIQQMSGINLTLLPAPIKSDSVLDTVYGLVSGEGRDMQIQFDADPKLFNRLARNMIGGEPEDENEVQEYAVEFFNVLCGRFISEICRMADMKVRFRPMVYESAREDGKLKIKGPIRTLHFQSDENEYAQFSWSQEPIAEILKGRSCYEA